MPGRERYFVGAETGYDKTQIICFVLLCRNTFVTGGNRNHKVLCMLYWGRLSENERFQKEGLVQTVVYLVMCLYLGWQSVVHAILNPESDKT